MGIKLIIAGSRTLAPSCNFIMDAIKSLKIYNIDEVVSGCARGVDTEGEHWASHFGAKIKRFPADWDTHGKAAGAIRNKQMADYADALLLIWDGSSRGSANMREQMLKQNKPVYEVILKNVA